MADTHRRARKSQRPVLLVIPYIAAQLRASRFRTLTFFAGVLLATVSFSLLAASASTSEVAVRGTLASHFQTPYDILVRPKGTVLTQETTNGLVQPNFEGDLFGGISLNQWQTVLGIPGVSVAAPLENIGYVLAPQTLYVDIGRFLPTDRPELFRLHLTWLANNATAAYPGQTPYVYVTPVAGGCGLPQPRKVVPPDPSSAYDVEGPGQGNFTCYEVIKQGTQTCFSWDGDTADSLSGPNGACKALVAVDVSVPRLLAAIDPAQENKLLPLDTTIVAGQPLTEGENAETLTTPSGAVFGPRIPVMVSSRSYVDESLTIGLDAVTASAQAVDQAISYSLLPPGEPKVPPIGDFYKWDAEHFALVSRLPANRIGQLVFGPATLFEGDVSSIGQEIHGGFPAALSYWSLDPTRYTSTRGVLDPVPLPPDPSLGGATIGPATSAPLSPSSQDTWFHQVQQQYGTQLQLVPATIAFAVRSTFDPAKLPGSDPLAAVPLAYSLPEATPADPSTSTALGGKPYLPTRNVGGFIAQPPFLLTTLQAAQPLVDGTYFSGPNPSAPISLIRVRVAGVLGDDQQSISRIRTVANLIYERTGLTVDVMAGSSPVPTLVRLPASKFGTPSLLLSQNWVKKGAVLSILAALDRKSLLLVVLMLVVTVIFLGLAGMTTVRTRRREFGLLLCMGWRPREIFASVLAEMALLGAAAGLIGTLAAYLIARLAHLSPPGWSLELAAPVAVVVTVLAGLLPATLAARGSPLDAVQLAVIAGRTSRRVRTLEGMAWLNSRRMLGRSLMAIVALVCGVAALTILLVITFAFQGVVSGTLLGNFVAVEVRSSDYAAVALTLVFAIGALAEVLVLSTRERAVELTTLRATGWSVLELMRLVATEGLELGLIGSVLGAAVGLGAGLLLGGAPSVVLRIAILAGGAGVVATLLAAIVPSRLVSLRSVTELSAEA
jgi:putative ABC transport system permease protein